MLLGERREETRRSTSGQTRKGEGLSGVTWAKQDIFGQAGRPRDLDKVLQMMQAFMWCMLLDFARYLEFLRSHVQCGAKEKAALMANLIRYG